MFQITNKVKKKFGDIQRGAQNTMLGKMITLMATDTHAQGNIVGFYVYIALAVVLGLQFALPVIQSAVATANVTGTALTLLNNFPLFLVLGIAILLLKPVTG